MFFPVFDDFLKKFRIFSWPGGIFFYQIPGFPVAVGTMFIASNLFPSIIFFFQIPIVGSTASSDELSDKLRYEYFLRVVPPDKYQTQAILDFLAFHNWTYASLLFSAGNYGENGAKHLEYGAKQRGICFAVSIKIAADASEDDFNTIAEDLVKYHHARAVVLFVASGDAAQLFQAMERIKEPGMCVNVVKGWITNEMSGMWF